MIAYFIICAFAALAAGFALGWLSCGLRRSGELAEREARVKELSATLESRVSEKDSLIMRLEAERERLKEREDILHRENAALARELASARTELLKERESFSERIKLLDEARGKLGEAFKALSNEALEASAKSFLRLANETLSRFQEGARSELELRSRAIDGVVKPLKESLEKFESVLKDVEKERVGAYEGLKEQIRSLNAAQKELREETSNLARALKMPAVKGRWGEIQLRRVVELAGMLEHCDFAWQEAVLGEGEKLRPDLIVRLPGGRSVAVDAKAPLRAYFEALETDSEDERRKKLKEHAALVRMHVSSLSSKSYWESIEPSPDFVVLFIPGENFFSAALEQAPDLVEYGVERKIIMATPTTMIALLRAIAYGWRQERMAESARLISDMGRELFERASKMTEHLRELGEAIKRAVSAYNRVAGSFERRVLVTARKFRELGVTGAGDMGELRSIDTALKDLPASEDGGGEGA